MSPNFKVLNETLVFVDILKGVVFFNQETLNLAFNFGIHTIFQSKP